MSLSCMYSVFKRVWHVIKHKATILWNVSIIILFKCWLDSIYHPPTSLYWLMFFVLFLSVFYTFEFVCVFVSSGVTLTQLTGHILGTSMATLTCRSGNCSSLSGQYHNSHQCQLMCERTHFYLSELFNCQPKIICATSSCHTEFVYNMTKYLNLKWWQLLIIFPHILLHPQNQEHVFLD